MDRWHNYYVDGHPHWCTAVVTDREPVLLGTGADVLLRVWEDSRARLGVKVLAFVVMPEHYHIVLYSEHGKSVAEFLRRTASLTSKQLKPGGGLWREKPRVLPVHSAGVLKTKVDYLHRNPLRRGLVENPEDWAYSSFRQLELGLVDVPFGCDDWGLISL